MWNNVVSLQKEITDWNESLIKFIDLKGIDCVKMHWKHVKNQNNSLLWYHVSHNENLYQTRALKAIVNYKMVLDTVAGDMFPPVTSEIELISKYLFQVVI